MSRRNQTTKPDRLCYTIDELAEAASVARTRIYDEISQGRLKTFKIGRRRMIAAEAVRDWLAGMQEAA